MCCTEGQRKIMEWGMLICASLITCVIADTAKPLPTNEDITDLIQTTTNMSDPIIIAEDSITETTEDKTTEPHADTTTETFEDTTTETPRHTTTETAKVTTSETPKDTTKETPKDTTTETPRLREDDTPRPIPTTADDFRRGHWLVTNTGMCSATCGHGKYVVTKTWYCTEPLDDGLCFQNVTKQFTRLCEVIVSCHVDEPRIYQNITYSSVDEPYTEHERKTGAIRLEGKQESGMSAAAVGLIVLCCIVAISIAVIVLCYFMYVRTATDETKCELPYAVFTNKNSDDEWAPEDDKPENHIPEIQPNNIDSKRTSHDNAAFVPDSDIIAQTHALYNT